MSLCWYKDSCMQILMCTTYFYLYSQEPFPRQKHLNSSLSYTLPFRIPAFNVTVCVSVQHISTHTVCTTQKPVSQRFWSDINTELNISEWLSSNTQTVCDCSSVWRWTGGFYSQVTTVSTEVVANVWWERGFRKAAEDYRRNLTLQLFQLIQ